MSTYKIVCKLYRAAHLSANNPLEFEEEINRLAEQKWEVKFSNCVTAKISEADWVIFYALMERKVKTAAKIEFL
ncbi:MAG: hypothetical protein QXN87_07195 [Candidatus Bathyarchaeia archaeon]